MTESRDAPAIDERLLESEERLRLVIAATNDLIWDLDLRTGHVWHNERYREEFGSPEPEEAAWTWWGERLHPDDRSRVLGSLAAARDGSARHWTEEYRYRRRDGRWAEILDRAYVVRDAEGRATRVIGAMLDQTSRKQTETQLRQLFLAVEQSPVSTVITDLSGEIQYVNDAFLKISGYSRAEVIGRNPRLLQSGQTPASTYADLWSKLCAGEVWQGQLSNRRKEGDVYLVTTTISPLRQPQGQVTHYVAVQEDITERQHLVDSLEHYRLHLEALVTERTRELDEARARAESASQAKSQFLATMSHEIRTPINGVIGSVDLLVHTPLSVQQFELVETIRESSTALREVIDDILDFSKIEAGGMELEHEPLSPRRLVEGLCGSLQPLAVRRQVRLRLFTDPALPETILGDSVRLRQILSNLVSNAIKFSSGSGRQGEVAVRLEPAAGSALHLSVSDNGIGMSAEVQAKLFTPFLQAESDTTRRFGGTGLGLSIIRRLLDLLDGEIRVESSPGEGSTFHVTFPVKVVDAVESEGQVACLRGLDCLVVSATEGVARGWCAYLTDAGAQAAALMSLRAAGECLAAKGSGQRILMLDTSESEAMAWLKQSGIQPPPALVIVEPNRRRSPRLLRPGLVSVGDAPLTQSNCVAAVCAAAGRCAPAESLPQANDLTVSFTPPDRASAIAQGRLVLVAEDNEVNQKVIRRQLAMLGFAADLVGTGREAVLAWHQQPYAALLTDLHMPEMDGFELARTLRAEEHEGDRRPIIALSANVLREAVTDSLAAGMDDYLSKPVGLDELRAVLEKWLPHQNAVAPSSISVPPSERPEAPLDVSTMTALVGDDPEMIRTLLADFAGAAAADVKALHEAVILLDWDALVSTTGRLKSSAQAVGARRLSQCCDQVQECSTARKPAGLPQGMQHLDRALAAVLSEIEQRLASDRGAEKAPILDESVLRGLIGDDPQLLAELLADFWQAAEQGIAEMQSAIAKGGWTTIGSIAHRLKSAARSIGALPLGESAERLERAGRADDGRAVAAEMEQFQLHLSAVLERIAARGDH